MECRVAQPEAEREEGPDALRVEPAVPHEYPLGVVDPAVRAGIAAVRGGVLHAPAIGDGELPGGVDRPGEDLGDRPPALLSGVPGLQHSGNPAYPVGGRDRAAGIDDHDRARVERGNLANEFRLAPGQLERAVVALALGGLVESHADDRRVGLMTLPRLAVGEEPRAGPFAGQSGPRD